jgi:predicted DNA-binding transcriptional regulator AlpA
MTNEYFDSRMYRQKQILGDSKATPPIEPIIPISASTWWKGIRNGLYPKGIKLSARVTVWRGSDLRKIIEGEGAQK